MALRRLHLTNSAAIVAGALVSAALLAAGCGGTQSPGARIAEDLICTTDDLHGTYFMQTSGEFSTRNLADLADNAPERKAELEAAGLLGGHFNYWKQAVGRPPFEAPIEVVCQVMEFGTETQAARFVRDLQVARGDLETTAITWLPRRDRATVELPAPGDPALPPGTRTFRLEAASREANVTLYTVVAARGRYVQSVYMGNGNGAATAGDAEAVLAHLVERSKAAVLTR